MQRLLYYILVVYHKRVYKMVQQDLILDSFFGSLTSIIVSKSALQHCTPALDLLVFLRLLRRNDFPSDLDLAILASIDVGLDGSDNITDFVDSLACNLGSGFQPKCLDNIDLPSASNISAMPKSVLADTSTYRALYRIASSWPSNLLTWRSSDKSALQPTTTPITSLLVSKSKNRLDFSKLWRQKKVIYYGDFLPIWSSNVQHGQSWTCWSRQSSRLQP
jgi:hypothetical protein